MIRATTPTHVFTLPFGRESINKLLITYAQDDKIILEKTENDVNFDENNISVTLTQEETILFTDGKIVQIQIRVLTPCGEALASRIYSISCDKVLNSEVMV